MPCRRLALMCIVFAVALPGCGSSSKSGSSQTSPSSSSTSPAAFKAGYLAIRGTLNQTGAAIGQELALVPKQSDLRVQEAFTSLADRFGAQLGRLEKLQPPPNLASDFTSLTSQARRFETDLRDLAAAAGRHSAGAFRGAEARLVADAAPLKRAAEAIRAKLGIR